MPAPVVPAPVVFEPVGAALPAGFDALAAAAGAEGHGFIARLATEWASGHNRFDHPGERLIAVRDGGALAAIGGVNRDPFLADPRVARLRHVYVHPDWRRQGIGALLARELIATARTAGFARLRLRTANPAAARLYEALGFATIAEPDATHGLVL
jgi:GNAT superfamily N-acetyltransferase